MNDLLQLKGNFYQKTNESRPGSPQLPSKAVVDITVMRKLYDDLIRLQNFWREETYLRGALISVYYKQVIAKSRRVSGYLANGKNTANSSIVGARFTTSDDKRKHIITHYVSMDVLALTITRLRCAMDIVNHVYDGTITYLDTIPDEINAKDIDYGGFGIKKTNFLNMVVDSYYVEKFDVFENQNEFTDRSIITIFKTDDDTKSIMEKIGIKMFSQRILDETTLLLTPDEFAILNSRAPYLISMATTDFSELTKSDFFDSEPSDMITIPDPDDEPVIGVIDTMFDENVYFSNWVEFEKRISDDIPLTGNDYRHGTAVSSIIVDGPTINPDLDDGCGRFRVKHFGVASGGRFSSFSIVRSIKEIIAENKDIKVWNLSLGSREEVDDNFISPEAAILDKIQFDNDVIFVIAGTNKVRGDKEDKVIGSPADSINSLVVNAVDANDNPPAYARRGIVLSFFNKPDICSFGGSEKKYMKVCEPNGESYVAGTSYAAPWISRKMAYLIHKMGLSREVAKAVIIDSATTWDSVYTANEASLLGHGIVPQRIEDVINSKDDEIKFILSGVSEKYDTYNYNIPVPVHKDEHPFLGKATMCYFPKCSRNQGVDYTNTELDIYFGRITDDNKIKSINKNTQSIEGVASYLREDNARRTYRKWDNSKHIREKMTNSIRARKSYSNKMWGLSIKTKERLETKDGEGIRFGIVVTLKEINGVNRIDTFIQQCALRGWLVNKINVENRIDIYNKANEDIEFE